ncbi:hypothetical protein OFR20_10050 [Brachyspira hyodysenteriae]|nr:hypothetical protein [Brachyspira hyodysenteriae]MCZ9981856.1 hypothetical protein [Brachyspira hyodysenteriae]
MGDKKIVSKENTEEVKSVVSKKKNTDTKDNKYTAYILSSKDAIE